MPTPDQVIRPILRARQVREFTDEPVDAEALDALADAARWSGSSRNSQPWRFIVLRDRQTIAAVAAAGLPHTRALTTATAAIAIALPVDPEQEISHAYDEGRATERILVAASMLGLAAGVAWVAPAHRQLVDPLLGVPEDHAVRTVVAIGHPTDAARQSKSAPGQARLPRSETVFDERWPA